MKRLLVASALAVLMLSTPLALADHTSGHNISTSVDSTVDTWIPLIITLVFLGLGLGVLFAAVNKMKAK